MSALLVVYGTVRVFDLSQRHLIGAALSTSYEAVMLQIEFALGVIIPLALLAIPKVRATTGGLYAAAAAVVRGFVANRLNVSITGFEAAQGGHDLPAVSEVLISLAVVAAAIVGFHFGARLLQVFPTTGRLLGPAHGARD